MKVGFLFPGQGSQYVGMGKTLCDRYEPARKVYAEAEQVLGWDVQRLCFEGPEAQLNRTEYTQPALLTTSIAAWRAMGGPLGSGVTLAGHSLGEYSALVAAGAVSFSDAVRVVHLRGRFMQEAVPEGQGAMAAIIGLSGRVVDDVCSEISRASGKVASANYNGPIQVVIAGEVNAVESAMRLALEKGAKRAVRLAVSVPSHCELMREASRRLSVALEDVEGSDFEVPIVNNLAAKRVNTWKAAREGLVDQIASPLLWEETIASMRDSGIDRYFEIGPGKVLTGLLKRIDRSAKIINVEDPKGVESAVALIKSGNS